MKILLNNLFKDYLAHAVTIAGLILAIWFLMAAIKNPEEVWFVFFLAGTVSFTDFIDGSIARKFGRATEFGSILDRVRDRAFVYPALVIFTWHHRWKLMNLPFATSTLTAALIIVILIIEVLLFIACCIGVIWRLGGSKINLNPNQQGRKKTFSGFVVVLLWLLSLTIEKYLGFPLIKFSIFVIDFGLVLMIYWAYQSLVDYCKRTKET